MKLFSTAVRVINNTFNKVTANFSLIPSWYLNVRFTLASKYLALVHQGYKRNAVAYSCIRLLAESVPEARLKIYKLTDQGEAEDPNHPLRKLIQNPNPLQTEFEFWELTMIHLNVCGISHWWKERNNAGKVIALWPLRPDRVSPYYDDGFHNSWYYNLEGQQYLLPKEDVFTVNLPDPEDPTGGIVEGLGPLQVIARDVETYNQATFFAFAILKNYAMPGVVIKTKAKLDPKQAERLKANFKQKYGQMNMGEPAILDADTEVSPISFNLRELEFEALRGVTQADICAAFKVPAILVGVKVGLDKAHFSNQREAREFFTETTLAVYWRRLEDQIQSDLVPEFDDSTKTFARFDTSTVKALAGQIIEKVKPYAEGFTKGAVSRNEYRERLNLKPLDQDAILVPRGMVELLVTKDAKGVINVIGYRAAGEAQTQKQETPAATPSEENVT